MQFRPIRTTGTALGIAASVWAVLFAALLVLRGATQPVSVSTALCYLLAGVFVGIAALVAYWTYACAGLRYELDRNGLVIHCGFVRQVIPLDSVKKVTPGELVPLPGIEGVGWPGYHVGRAKVQDIGETLFYSTHRRPGELVYVLTASQVYAISPPDVRRFVSEIESARKEGVELALRQAPRRMPLGDQPFWLDRYAQGLALLAILLCAATAGVIFANYGGLPASLAISFPPLDVERVASKHELLSLPATALGVLLVSLVAAFAARAWEKLASYTLLTGLIAVQVVFLWGAAVAVS
ncbi:MAG: PH domain-containing protein [Dehalococcoidia bacterium]|jgi:hypothetical protein